MNVPHIDILLRLFIAHFLADFLLQSDTMAREKKKIFKSRYFYFHILMVGVATYLLLGDWTNWLAPAIIMAIHASIDALKALAETKWKIQNAKLLFIWDQVLHFITLSVYWSIVYMEPIQYCHPEEWALYQLFTNPKMLLMVVAYLAVSTPAGILIGHITKKWQDEIEEDGKNRKDKYAINESKTKDSLKDAGKTIGIIERILVLTFVILNQYQAIGFLIAAKSVFRFGDLQNSGQRKRTEYILIGTLLSFVISIALGIAVKYLLTQL